MRAINGMTKKVATGALGLVAAAGIGGAAWAATSGPSSSSGQIPAALSTSASSTTPSAGGSSAASGAAGKKALGLLRRTDHATAEVKVKGQWVTYNLDRGKVTAISPTSITLLRPDGQSVTFTINGSTRYGASGSESTIATGRAAAVISQNGVALRIRQGAGQASAGTGGSTPSSGTAGAATSVQ